MPSTQGIQPERSMMMNISQHRSFQRTLATLCFVVFCALRCADTSLSQEIPGWADGATLPATAQRAVSQMLLKSQPFQTGQNMLGAANNGLEVSLSQLEERFENIHVEDGEMKIRIIFDSDILFDFDKSSIRADAETSLQAVANVLKPYQGKTIRIVGHTDSKGSDTYNEMLSRKRAESVKAWLSARAELGGFTFAASGRGKLEPIAPNTLPDGSDNPSGRQKNRRVELEIPKAM